ncbi:MAG TPA: hypothetical protein VK181_15155 [Rhizobium sp.]|nr:hypothetical protein [Rhizobium sp.]
MSDDRRRIDISKGPVDGNAAPRSSMIVILARYRRAATAGWPMPHRQNGNWTVNVDQHRFARSRAIP